MSEQIDPSTSSLCIGDCRDRHDRDGGRAAPAERCILAGSRPGDLVLDPFLGSGTTAMVAEQHRRRWVGFEANPTYAALVEDRLARPKLAIKGCA